jgi:hypothetical protein
MTDGHSGMSQRWRMLKVQYAINDSSKTTTTGCGGGVGEGGAGLLTCSVVLEVYYAYRERDINCVLQTALMRKLVN